MICTGNFDYRRCFPHMITFELNLHPRSDLIMSFSPPPPFLLKSVSPFFPFLLRCHINRKMYTSEVHSSMNFYKWMHLCDSHPAQDIEHFVACKVAQSPSWSLPSLFPGVTLPCCCCCSKLYSFLTSSKCSHTASPLSGTSRSA